MKDVKVTREEYEALMRLRKKLQRETAKPIKRVEKISAKELQRMAQTLREVNGIFGKLDREMDRMEKLFDRDLNPADEKWANAYFDRVQNVYSILD